MSVKNQFVARLAAGLLSVSVLLMGANAHAISVDAYSNSSSGGTGADTGIYLTAGEAFSVTVDPTDLWSAGDLPRWSNADGLVGDLYATGMDESGAGASTLIGIDFGFWTQNGLSLPFGTLVGEIAGTFFKLGTSFSGPAPVAGFLKLYYWDSNNYDNAEKIAANIEVRVKPVPEPASMLLLGSGLLGLVGLNRRRRA